MSPLTREEVGQFWLDSPVLQTQRKIAHHEDWGDQATVGINLKRRGVPFYQATEECYGLYLGKHEKGFVVGIKSWVTALKSGELFETLEELKQRWEID